MVKETDLTLMYPKTFPLNGYNIITVEKYLRLCESSLNIEKGAQKIILLKSIRKQSN